MSDPAPSDEPEPFRYDVEMRYGETPLVHEGDAVCAITDHFERRETVVAAPFTALIVGVLQSPVAAPGHPLAHPVRVEGPTLREIEREIESGEFSERPYA